MFTKRIVLASGEIVFLFMLIVVFSPKMSNSANAQQQVFTGHESHNFSLSAANALIRNHRRNQAPGNVIGGYISGDAIRSLLTQSGAVGLRAYFAKQDNGTPTLVLAGVDASGNDISAGIILEQIYPCPPFCSTENDLNR